jgi:hypothetical protein
LELAAVAAREFAKAHSPTHVSSFPRAYNAQLVREISSIIDRVI